MIRLLVAGVFIPLALTPAAAKGETWCLKSFGQERGACVFSTGRDCAAAARFNAFGGVCEREPLGEPRGMKRRLSGDRRG